VSDQHKKQMTPQLKTYYEIRYDLLIEEIREIAKILGRSNPVPTKHERVWLKQNFRSGCVDVIGAKR